MLRPTGFLAIAEQCESTRYAKGLSLVAPRENDIKNEMEEFSMKHDVSHDFEGDDSERS